MILLLHGLFYLGVLALVVGCFVYLFVNREPREVGRTDDREPERLSPETVKKAEELSGSYRLSDLERIFQQLGASEAWGVVLELRFTTVQEEIQMTVNRNEVEFCTPILDPSYTDRFRQAVRQAGLQARTGYTEGQYCVDITGTWATIAGTLRSISRSIYGVDENEEIQALIFN